MASKYDLSNHDSEDARETEPQGPPLSNLFAAATFIACLLTTHNIPYAMMGGFAMLCRGSRRTTLDVDVAVNATMRVWWAVVEPQPRLVIPDRKTLAGVLKIFVRTGPGYGSSECTEDRLIEVDLVRPGSKGTPLSLLNHTTRLQITLPSPSPPPKTITFNVLDILYMMKTKLNHCSSRALPRDLEDLQFLLTNYDNEIRTIADQLDEEDREYFFGLEEVRMKDRPSRERWREVLGLDAEEGTATAVGDG